jgi:hypothetical protein
LEFIQEAGKEYAFKWQAFGPNALLDTQIRIQ